MIMFIKLLLPLIIGFVFFEAQIIYLYICNLKEQKKADSESMKAEQQDRADTLRRLMVGILGVFLIGLAGILTIVLFRYLGQWVNLS